MSSAVVVIALIVLMIPILAILLDSDLGKAIAKRLERGRVGDGSDHVHERLLYLEGELDRLGQDVERLEEESRFLQNLLGERSESGRLSSGDRPADRRTGAAGRATQDGSPGG